MKVEELAGATEGRPTNTPPDITATTIPANGQVAAMGYMPSCKVAQAALGAIDPACPQLNLTAKFVDNIAFFGNSSWPAHAMTLFKARAASCGAVINDEDNSARPSLDFLGEHYCLVSKTRSLTGKSVKKLSRIQEILDRYKKEAKMTCRLFMAIIGSLLYCGEVLAVDSGFCRG